MTIRFHATQIAGSRKAHDGSTLGGILIAQTGK